MISSVSHYHIILTNHFRVAKESICPLCFGLNEWMEKIIISTKALKRIFSWEIFFVIVSIKWILNNESFFWEISFHLFLSLSTGTSEKWKLNKFFFLEWARKKHLRKKRHTHTHNYLTFFLSSFVFDRSKYLIEN